MFEKTEGNANAVGTDWFKNAPSPSNRNRAKQMSFWQHLTFHFDMTQRHVVHHLELVFCSSHWFHKTVQDLEILGSPDSQIPPGSWLNSILQLSVIEDLLQQQVSFQAMEQQQFEWKNDGLADGRVTGIQVSRHPGIQCRCKFGRSDPVQQHSDYRRPFLSQTL